MQSCIHLVDTQWPSTFGGICTVMRAPLWRCFNMWWHWESLTRRPKAFSMESMLERLSE